MLIFCRKIIVNKPALSKKKGPLLLACNHPNSFLDAVILAEVFEQHVHSLARGDVFKNSFYIGLLRALKISPIYRSSEGVENLSINYETFAVCKEIFKQNGIVLIFSEGQCINEWHLRSLKKGTARLAFGAWEENIPLEILPVGINYSSFRRFSKNVFINFGEIITMHDFDLNHGDGKRYQSFTNKLQEQLEQLVFEIDKNDIQKQKQLLEKKPSVLIKTILFIPSIIGLLLHAPLYLPLKNFTYKKTRNNDHYDSVLVSLLLFTYPLYVALIAAGTFILTHNSFSLLLVIILPFTAWAYVQVKPQLDKQEIRISST
ncbi:MAG TPA: 1-acyl-sn-glycerol-3-phosphate acyltransferase [Chitinophagaceae bacterium]|jgi:1-acyl-sn-glycerol-3-phosphate acyltransferase|nr:1-acyl-sn-glycerol-3-phosphate acyltransferase [Chitinophagaceae bacterium]